MMKRMNVLFFLYDLREFDVVPSGAGKDMQTRGNDFNVEETCEAIAKSGESTGKDENERDLTTGQQVNVMSMSVFL